MLMQRLHAPGIWGNRTSLWLDSKYVDAWQEIKERGYKERAVTQDFEEHIKAFLFIYFFEL